MNIPDERRSRLNDAGIQPIGMFAVMKHARTQAKFVALHVTRETAIEEARRLASTGLALRGPTKTNCYYVIQIVDRVGIINGCIEEGWAV